MTDVITKDAFSSPTRSIAKAVSWRILGSIDTAILGYIFTGSWKIAGSIASTEVITKIALYYFHERGWAHVRFGMKRPDVTAADNATS
jgi:uncharacterized membrane protein